MYIKKKNSGENLSCTESKSATDNSKKSHVIIHYNVTAF